MSNLLTRAPTPYDDRIYSDEWCRWRDPDILQTLDPVSYLIDRHQNTPVAAKPAIVCGDETVTYAELAGEMARYAAALAGLELAPEQRLLLFGTDSLDYVTLWLASIRLGAIPVVISDLYKAKDLAYFLTDTAVSLLFIDAEQLPKLLDIADDLPSSLKTILVRGEVPADLAALLPGRTVIALRSALAQGGPAVAPFERHANDVAYMFYSGGTTGTAKGITHLAHDFVLVPARHGHFWEYSADDVVFATSKKYFTHGLWPGVLIPLFWGATIVLDRRPPTPEVVLAALSERKVSKLITVPTVLKNMIEAMMKAKEPMRFPALRLVISASEKMPPEMFERFYDLTGVELFDSIGSSEITYEWIANRPKVFKRGSLGKPVFGCTIRLIDADGEDVTEPNVPGEAWVKSPTACFYYWRKYDKSRETFVGEWARTGDNLCFDEDGFFWFSGRNNDLFKVKGLWVSPIDIEAALTAHPAVREAAAVSFEDKDGLTKPRAFVVLRDGFSQSPQLIEELKAAVASLGSYKIPESIRFIDQLPRTTLLKIDRKALRE
ncbi:MAG: AMP-binding protein [Pseudolabrys sp.]|jgi:benzoate-CoA ligase